MKQLFYLYACFVLLFVAGDLYRVALSVGWTGPSTEEVELTTGDGYQAVDERTPL